MAFEWNQFWSNVDAQRKGAAPLAGTPTPENPQAGGSGGFDHSQASYGNARAIRGMGGVTPGTWRPERPAGFRA